MAMQDMQDRATDTVQAVREQAAVRAKEIAEQAAAKAAAGAEKAREVGSTLASETSTMVKEVPHRVSEDVVPTLRDIALQAASAALELWQVAREKAGEAADASPIEAGDAAHLVEVVQNRAKDAKGAIAGRVEVVGSRAKGAKSAAADRVEEVGERAKDASAKAAEVAVDTSKDTGAALLWAGAAAAVIFYAIVSRERREQIMKAADAVIKQIRELVRDFQGYDEEFA
jgi:hypothetical protein